MIRMRAFVLKSVGDLQLTEIPLVDCQPHEARIRVEACAICGTDLKVYRHGHRLLHPPRVIGHEVAGVIDQVGKEVTGFQEGERVIVCPVVPCGGCYYCRRGITGQCEDLAAIGYAWDGGFAEYMIVPGKAIRAGNIQRIPDKVSFSEAALVEPLACVLNAHELTPVSIGDSVAIIGAGPLGCFHAELSRAAGASRIMMVETSAGRLEEARKAGADTLINAKTEDAVSRVKEVTKGRGADLVITACSSGQAQQDALRMVAKRGQVNFFGGLPKESSVISIDSNLIHYGEFKISGTSGSSVLQNEKALNLIEEGVISVKKYITAELPLASLVEGIENMEKGIGLKTIIKPQL